MAIDGNICIFKLYHGSGITNETSTIEPYKVEFDGDAAVPDAKSHVSNYKVVMSLVTQENPNPDSNNPNSLQDTGLAIVQYDIMGFFNAKDGVPKAIADIVTWMSSDKTDETYKFGRFGIRNDQRPEYDVVPTATKGLILEHFETDYDFEYSGNIPFTLRLRYNGDISGLG